MTLTNEQRESLTETAKSAYASIVELVRALNVADECGSIEALERAEEAIHADALEVSVRSDWHSPGETLNEPAEFRILLSTGGPAVRIVGTLDPHWGPDHAVLEVQDWFTPWTDAASLEGLPAGDEIKRVCLEYAAQFYFGES